MRRFGPAPLYISEFEIEKRHGLCGLMSYIAESITLARPRCTPVWGFIHNTSPNYLRSSLSNSTAAIFSSRGNPASSRTRTERTPRTCAWALCRTWPRSWKLS